MRPVATPGAGARFISTEDVSSLRRTRRYAVPRWMIERSAERRLAGDWRGALAVAGVDVAFDPAGVAASYGTAVASALVSDLRHLVPDLVRWHLPRFLGGRSTLDTDRTVVLAGYGDGSGLPLAPYLHLRTPAMADGPQRLTLGFGDLSGEYAPGVFAVRIEDWRVARYLWDARHTDGLRAAAGGGRGRIPFFHDDGTPLTSQELAASGDDAAGRAERVTLLHQEGKASEAFAAAGIEWEPAMPDSARSWRGMESEAILRRTAVDIARLDAAVRRATAVTGREQFLIANFWRGNVLLDLTDHSTGGRLRARVVESGRSAVPFPSLPEAAWRRLPDLDLLRAGAMQAHRLHPLVARALFPALEGPFGPPGPSLPRPVRVRCRGEWHEVAFRDGALSSPHTEEERQRESAMRAFGGAVAGCFAVEHSCATGTGRLPKDLRAQRRELFMRAQHGDTPGVLELLAAGIDLRVKDGRRRGLLHVLPLLDHEALLPRLLEAGLDLEARDSLDRTPLAVAVAELGSVALVRALLDAGARIDVVDSTELSLAQLVGRYRRKDLGFLRERVVAEHPGIGSEWYDRWIDTAEEDEEQ
ncbi:ankyrin repeat domain-containing protein [Streptomyces sp. NPDC057067]|uniref:ankyrin repeat domain-containing protein n=1 Tax=unclassified Streptomyces TaxID=2593676 RepID=UPI00363BCC82